MGHPKLATSQSGYGGRGYRVPGRGVLVLDEARPKFKGKWIQDVYPSVTTVLKQSAKPALLQWVADQTAAFAVANISYLQAVSEEQGWGGLRFFWNREPDLAASELRLHHDGVKNDAAELGTNVHEWIEAEIDGTLAYPELDSNEAEQMAEQFEMWMLEHEVISHGAEFTLVNDELKIAGTADADWSIKCLHDGPTCLGQEPGEFVRTLVDLKTSRHTWPEHGMQLAALNSCDRMMVEVPEGYEGAVKHEATVKGVKEISWWIEMDSPSFEKCALLHMRPTDLDTKGETIPAFCELVDRTEDLDIYLDGFKGALALTHMNKKIKDRTKARQIETENA